MNVAAVQCDNCGSLVHDPAATRCPRCRTPLAAPTMRVPAPAPALGDSWAEIDGAWEDVDTEVGQTRMPEGAASHLAGPAGPARTLVGMGVVDDAVVPPPPQSRPVPMPLPSIPARSPQRIALPSSAPISLPPSPPARSPLAPPARSPSSRPPPVVGVPSPAPAPAHLSPAFEVELPQDEPWGLPTMPLEPVAPTGRFARQVAALDDELETQEVETQEVEVESHRERGGEAGLPTLPPEGLPEFKGLPTLDMQGPPEEHRGEVESSFAASAFDDLSIPADADERRQSEVKTLLPIASSALPDPVDSATTERRPSLLPSQLPPPDDAAFTDNTMNARSGRPLQAARPTTSAGLIVLWIVAVAATVAALLLVLLK